MKVTALLSFLTLICLWASTPPAAGQNVPRTANGRPNLQGVWNFCTMTPLERPDDLGDQAFLSEEEVATREAAVTGRRAALLEPSDIRREPLPAGGGGRAVGGYNNNMQLFQTADHVVILNEMVRDLRIIPLDGRPHLPQGVRQWAGSSRGY